MSDLHDLSLADVARRIQSREITSLEVTHALLARIRALDGRLRCYATVTEENALAQAGAADAEIARGELRGPLHGVPVGIKDLCATKDAPTHGGTPALRDWSPGVDATAVARLRAAGAVFLGKLQLSEAAYAIHHPTVTPPSNPWGAGHWPGVSSSGSAAAVAACLCFGALGTDTGGSIRFPAHCCGVTGLKPTRGRVSRAGALPMSETLDHLGPIARSAADAAVLLGVLAGHDPQDPATEDRPVPGYLAGLDQGIQGLRIGFDEHHCTEGTDPAVTAMLRDAAEAFRRLGAEIVPVRIPSTAEALRAWTPIFCTEAAISHRATYPAKANLYSPAFAQVLEQGAKTPKADYDRAQAVRTAFTTALEGLFAEVDLILSPALPYPTPTNAFMDTLLREGGDALERLIAFTAPHNMSGSPTLSLPGGFDAAGLPLGFQLVGPHWGEALLLRAGHAYQQETGWHLRRPALPS
jgi:amidase